MILIFSKRDFEVTTETVIDWLDKRKANYVRQNGNDYYEDLSIEEGKIKSIDFDPDEINVIWNRRWADEGTFIKNNESDLEDLGMENVGNLMYNLTSERLRTRSLLHRKLKDCKWTTRPSNTSLDKLFMLAIAKESGIKTPAYIITSRKSELKDFINRKGKVISKPISEVASFFKMTETENERAILLTQVFEQKDLVDFNDEFHFTLFQEYIEKQYELRIFYLDDKFYAMAIFSQNDDQTKTDFRNYNTEKPNRYVPYRLTEELEQKLRTFISKSKLNIGSFDLIKTMDGEYYFLEINPVGQFGMVSGPCNYFLEKKLANYLIKNDVKNI